LILIRKTAFILLSFCLVTLLVALGCHERALVTAPAAARAPGQASAAPQPMVAAPLHTELSDKVYILGPDDELSVVISGNGGYRESVDVKITAQGTVILPMLNEVTASGLTVTEFSKKVERLLSVDYLVSPKIYVTLKARKSHKVTLVGEIASAGTYYLQAERELLKDVIIRAGGPVNGFNKTVFLIRPPASGRSEKGLRPHRWTCNLLDLMNDTSGKLNVPVEAGDIIYVLSGEHAREFSGSEEGNVLVFGQVKNPGIITYSNGLTVLRAILKAGNFTEGAAKSRVQVKRKRNGKVITLKVNINLIIEGGDQSADLLLQPGDVVYVPRSIF